MFWTCGLLQMLLPILYLHNMRYRTNPMTQTRENGRKPRFWANFDIIMLIMREIIIFLISLKNVLDLRSFANASTHFILAAYAISDRSNHSN